MSVCFDHAQHTKSFDKTTKDSKDQKGATISQDDDCQCALHLQMSNLLLPENQLIEFKSSTLVNDVISHSQTYAYLCLLDYFSSRAPPVAILTVA